MPPHCCEHILAPFAQRAAQVAELLLQVSRRSAPRPSTWRAIRIVFERVSVTQVKAHKGLDVLKNAATRAARRAPEDTSCEALFDDCTEAQNELHRRRGYSPFQLLIGRSPPGLPLNGDKQLGEVSASLTSDGRHRLHIQRECYRAYLDEEMSLQQKRREMHKSRPFRVWSSGEWCWFWRSRAHLHRRTKASRQFKEGAFLGPARVLLQERERKGDDLKYKATVWLVDGDQLYVVPQLIFVRCRRRNKHCVR